MVDQLFSAIGPQSQSFCFMAPQPEHQGVGSGSHFGQASPLRNTVSCSSQQSQLAGSMSMSGEVFIVGHYTPAFRSRLRRQGEAMRPWI